MNRSRTLQLPPKTGQPDTIRAMMQDVIVALLPTLAMATFFFGVRVLSLAAVSVATCVGLEWLYRRLTHQEQSVWDLSACVTGLLLALSLPATTSYLILILGCSFSIILVKQFYGGIGKNFMNPALAGRMLLATFPVLMTRWSQPLDRLGLFGVDAVSAPTPLYYLSRGTLPPLNLSQMFLGQHGGCMGEVASFMVLFGGCYLILRRVISVRIPASYLGCVMLLSLLTAPTGISSLRWMLMQIFSGGMLIAAFFFAADPVTSPVTPRAQVLYGIGCGLLSMLLRYFSSYPEGVGWAVLIMNCFVGLLDQVGMPRRFGAPRFSAPLGWLRRTRDSLRGIKFVKPPKKVHSTQNGKVPGENHLDQIRTRFRYLTSLGGVILGVVVLIFSVHYFTDLDTAQAELQKNQQLLAKVMPQAAFRSELPLRAAGALRIDGGYDENNELIGYCVQVQSHGFAGAITMQVGVDLNGYVTGVAITSHKEIPSVGTAALTDAALMRYVGRSGTLRNTGENSVDAVGGATASSQAVTAGVNRALAIVAQLSTQDDEISYVDGEV